MSSDLHGAGNPPQFAPAKTQAEQTANEVLEAQVLATAVQVGRPGLAVVGVLLRQHPRLAIVVDHAAKPDIARSPTPEWQDGMRQLAQRPNVACKLSGLVSQAPALLAPSAYARHFDFLLDVFAPDRLLWGSDWPVLTERCSYVDWWDITGQLLHGIPARSRDAILGLTAQTIYRLERP